MKVAAGEIVRAARRVVMDAELGRARVSIVRGRFAAMMVRVEDVASWRWRLCVDAVIEMGNSLIGCRTETTLSH